MLVERSSFFSPYFFKKVINGELKDCTTVLDLGCGRGSLIPCDLRGKKVIGMDIFGDYLDHLPTDKNGYSDFINANIMEVDTYFGEDSVDCVVLIEVVEHLKHDDAIQLLQKINKIAKKKIIIHTPNGFLKQDPYDGNEYQRHLSGYDTTFFRKEGFDKIYGMWGYKNFRGEFGSPIRPKFIFHVLSEITEVFVFKMARFAFQLLAIKHMQ